MSLLTKDEVLTLAIAEVAYKRAKAELDRLDAERKEARAATLHRLPVGEWVELFGIRLRHRQGATGDKFSLSAALAAGYKLPKHLQRFVTASRTTELLDLEPVADQPAELSVLAERVSALAATA